MKWIILLASLSVAVHAQITGETLFREKCSACHALPDPQGLNGRQWQAVLRTMQRRMAEAGKATLSDAELRAILCYLSGETSCPERK